MKRLLFLAIVAAIGAGCATTDPMVRKLWSAEGLSWVLPIGPPQSMAEQEAAVSQQAESDSIVQSDPDDIWLGVDYKW
jgi:hypothetical protein